MKKFILRGLCAVLGVAVVSSGEVNAQTADSPLAHSRSFAVEQMPVRKMANGGESRDIVHGILPTGESVALHESEQPAGMTPNQAHRIEHSEFIVVVEGTMEYLHDGKVEKVGPGGVIYVATGTEHQVKNVGGGPAKYVVVAIGGDVKK
jgi:mannose-6-phosphate isomerase-like protein (cupin superfamily)